MLCPLRKYYTYILIHLYLNTFNFIYYTLILLAKYTTLKYHYNTLFMLHNIPEANFILCSSGRHRDIRSCLFSMDQGCKWSMLPQRKGDYTQEQTSWSHVWRGGSANTWQKLDGNSPFMHASFLLGGSLVLWEVTWRHRSYLLISYLLWPELSW